LALGLLIAAARGLAVGDANIRAGGFQMGVPVGIGLAGKTLGVIGLGKLGGYMATYAKALRMNVIAWSQNLTAERAAEVGVAAVTKQELLEQSDVLSIHLVLSDRTRGLFGAGELARMRRSAVLVNTSRGPIVDESALVAALRDGTIAVAGLDVYDTEPLPAGDPLTGLDNVVLLPHLGYVSEATLRDMYEQVVEDIAAWRDGASIRTIE
jgi:phosphoglycerate dehydrogenase-like enzyme